MSSENIKLIIVRLTASRKWQAITAGSLIVFVLLLFVHLRLREYAFDDAYIHYRIARNFVEYGWPYYNPGEAVMASSSPGWTIFLALSILLGKLFSWEVDLVSWVAIFNALMITVGGVLYTIIFSRLLKERKAFYVYIIFYIFFISISISASLTQMETITSLVIFGFGLLQWINHRKSALIFLTISIFFRLEFTLFVGVIYIYGIIKRYFSLSDVIIFSTFSAVPFLIYEIFYFGTIIPNTIIAKQIVYELTFREFFLQFISQILGMLSYLSVLINITDRIKLIFIVYTIVFTVFCLVSFIILETRNTRHSPNVGPFYFKPALVLWFFSVLLIYLSSKSLIFTWYIPLYLTPLVLIISIALVENLPLPVRRWLQVLAAPLILIMSSYLGGIFWGTLSDPVLSDGNILEGARARNMVYVGRLINENCPGVNLLSSEIGGLGYGYTGRIIDGAGLVSPEALKHHPLKVPEQRNSGSSGAIPVSFIELTQPEVIAGYAPFTYSFSSSLNADKYHHYQLPILQKDDLNRGNVASIYKDAHYNIYVKNGYSCDLWP